MTSRDPRTRFRIQALRRSTKSSNALRVRKVRLLTPVGAMPRESLMYAFARSDGRIWASHKEVVGGHVCSSSSFGDLDRGNRGGDFLWGHQAPGSRASHRLITNKQVAVSVDGVGLVDR